jgi:hypothetical protein
MPKSNPARMNHAERSPPRVRQDRGAKAAAKATANEPAKQDKGARNRQHRSDHATRTPSKQQLYLELLSRRDGASIVELRAAPGWQPHSVRGFLSGTVKRKLGLTLISDPSDGPRRYRVAAEA